MYLALVEYPLMYSKREKGNVSIIYYFYFYLEYQMVVRRYSG